MDLSIIIVNWNSKDFLLECIASVEADTGLDGIKKEIIVIDSGSFDGSGEMLRKHYPQVIFIQSDKNVGFAKANNLAFEKSKGEFILFLNPDTKIMPTAINTLYQQLRTLQSAGAVGPRLLNGDGTVQLTCIRAFPTILNQFLESDLLRRWFPRSWLWGMAPIFGQTDLPCPVHAVSGACIMMRRSAFETIGMFSTDYFMYSEDIDICYKLKQVGLKTYYVPTAVVTHYGGESSSQSSVSVFSTVMMLESRWRFFMKTRPHWYGWFYRVSVCMASVLRIAAALLLWPLALFFGKTQKIGDIRKKWAAKLFWSLGGEKWVKSYPNDD